MNIIDYSADSGVYLGAFVDDFDFTVGLAVDEWTTFFEKETIVSSTKDWKKLLPWNIFTA
jgi:hypothetical protein